MSHGMQVLTCQYPAGASLLLHRHDTCHGPRAF